MVPGCSCNNQAIFYVIFLDENSASGWLNHWRGHVPIQAALNICSLNSVLCSYIMIYMDNTMWTCVYIYYNIIYSSYTYVYIYTHSILLHFIHVIMIAVFFSVYIDKYRFAHPMYTTASCQDNAANKRSFNDGYHAIHHTNVPLGVGRLVISGTEEVGKSMKFRKIFGENPFKMRKYEKAQIEIQWVSGVSPGGSSYELK